MDVKLQGEIAVVTGGTGVLCSAMAKALARAGANVAVLGRSREKADRIVGEISEAGGKAIGVTCDVTEKTSLVSAADEIQTKLGAPTILINGAGGNRPDATTGPDKSFFELSSKAVEEVVRLNYAGTFLACQVFGKPMTDAGRGCIVNITSMAALRPLTRVMGYSAVKAAVENFTRWLAVHVSQNYSTDIRVNAIAPGFFLTEQNRFLLQAEDGTWTARGQQILDHTPLSRFGAPEDLISTLLWLVSPSSSFVHGIVVPVDGGFSAYSGV